MKLRGQARRRRPRLDAGYAMAALLVAISVMAVLMTAAMPVWHQMNQREKEEELVFRGQQYVRAIGLFQRKTGPGVLPPNLDVLVDQRFLRRKYKDPISGEDFLLIPATLAANAQAQLQAAQTTNQSISPSNRSGQPAVSPYVAQGGPFGTNVPGGLTGVVSKSTDTSIRLYNGRNHYNEWEFRFIAPPAPAQGGGANGGGRGGPQRGPNGQPLVGPNGQPLGGPGRGRGGPDDGRGRGGDGRGRGGDGIGPPGSGGPFDGRGRGIQPGPNSPPPTGSRPVFGGR